jgi:hypothetical protein
MCISPSTYQSSLIAFTAQVTHHCTRETKGVQTKSVKGPGRNCTSHAQLGEEFGSAGLSRSLGPRLKGTNWGLYRQPFPAIALIFAIWSLDMANPNHWATPGDLQRNKTPSQCCKKAMYSSRTCHVEFINFVSKQRNLWCGCNRAPLVAYKSQVS